MANKKEKVALGVGAGVLAAAGAAAGYYFYASKDAKKNRKIAAKWASDLKKDVVKKAKSQVKVIKKLDAGAFASLVDDAAQMYHQVRNVDKRDVDQAARELKENWHRMEKELKGAVRSSAKKVTKTVKKNVKKVVARTASKKSKKNTKK